MKYVQLEVWKESRSLVISVYEMTKQLLKAEVYVLINQLRRCAISVPLNKECGRRTSRDAIQFVRISSSSICEPETQFYLALDQKYLLQTDFDLLKSQIKKLRNEFINYYKSSNK